MTPLSCHVFLPGFWEESVLILRERMGRGGEAAVIEGVIGGKCGTKGRAGFMVVHRIRIKIQRVILR